MSAHKQLVIKTNNTEMAEPCALCGRQGEASSGPAILVEGSDEFVCDACAAERDPELYAVYDAWCEANQDRPAWLFGQDESSPDAAQNGADSLIDTQALIAQVNALADRTEALLAIQGDAVRPEVATELMHVAQDIDALRYQLAFAQTAADILRVIDRRLNPRVAAYIEVFGLGPDQVAYREEISVNPCVFGPRFGPEPIPERFSDDLALSDDDVPF